MMTRNLTLGLAAAFAGVVVYAAPSVAQECALGPVALPALSGPPEWEDFNGDGFWRPELHDPRWSGAPLDFLTFIPTSGTPPAAADDAAIRVVADGKIVYVSYQIQADDTGPTSDDYVYLGVTEGSASGAYAFKIAADFSGTPIGTPAPPPPPAVVAADSPLPRELSPIALSVWHSVTGTAGSWGAASAVAPAWFKGAVWDRPVLTSPRWAVTVRLDLSPTGLNIAGNTKFFFGTTIHQSTGDVLVGNARPRLTTDADKIGDSTIPDATSNWVPYQEPGTACTSGITLVSGDIGVWTGTAGMASGGSLTNTICAGPGGTGQCTVSDGTNVFRATARNVDNTSGIGDFAVRARFRIADWGSQAWQFGRWTEVAAAPSPIGTNIFTAPTTDLTANGWHWLTPVASGGVSAVTIDYKCSKVGANTYCPKLTDETGAHQCMLVELGQPPPGAGSPPPFKVRNNAVYQNMNYENLSTSDVPATISLEGVKSLLGEAKDRDVYFYVENHNLPQPTPKAFALNSQELAFARRFAENPPFVPTVPGRTPNPDGGQILKKGQAAQGTKATTAKAPATPKATAAATGTPKATAGKAPPGKLGGAAPAAVNSQVSPTVELANSIATSKLKLSNGLPVENVLAMSKEQLLDAVWPTYRVRVYVDTGKTFAANGKSNRVLVPMAPFGYHFSHDGLLYGFTKAFAGTPGVVVQQISADWFRIHLQSEGSAKVRTQVTAVETLPGQGGGEGCPHCPKCPPVDHGHCDCRLVGTETGGNGYLAAALGLAVAAAFRRRRRRAA